MPDIFGMNRGEYQHIRDIDTQVGERAWDAHQQANGALLRSETRGNPDFVPHDFDSLGRWASNDMMTRAPEDGTALGFITNTGLQIMSMVDEIYYTANRVPEFISVNTSIAEGATGYAVRVTDIVGRMTRVSSAGDDVPTATVSRTLAQASLDYYGVDFEFTLQELREAMFQGVPLQQEDMKAVMAVAMNEVERVAFTGGDYPSATGLFNHPTSGANGVTQRDADKTFSDMSVVEIRTLINDQLSNVITASEEVVGRVPRLMEGMTVYLPQTQYDMLTTRYIGDNAERTLMRSLMEDNVWTQFTGRPLSILRVVELDDIVETAVNGSQARMVVGLKNPNVAELGMAISPRLIRLLDQGRKIRGQIEARFGEVWVKRPDTMRYLDGI